MSDINWVTIYGAVIGTIAASGWLVDYICGLFTKPRLKFLRSPFLFKYSSRRYICIDVGVANKKEAIGCIAKVNVKPHPKTATIYKHGYPLHWADTTKNMGNNVMEPVDIWGDAYRRLDIVFTEDALSNTRIAMASVLADPDSEPQAILQQGSYKLKVSLSCRNGKGTHKRIKMLLPEIYDELSAELVNP